MNVNILRWAPAAILGLGAILTVGAGSQQVMPLRAPLETTLPTTIQQFEGRDQEISKEEQRVAGMSDYLMRVYTPADASSKAAGFSLYVGYYESQTQGNTIHSPKNCLPGAGWEALTSTTATIATAAGAITVNRYLLQKDDDRALVLYWYQGRGRVESDEYKVKWDLLRDAILHGRSDEALVRIIVPIQGSEEEAYALATRIAQRVVPSVNEAIPS